MPAPALNKKAGTGIYKPKALLKRHKINKPLKPVLFILKTPKNALNNFILFLIRVLREKKKVTIKVKFDVLLILFIYLNTGFKKHDIKTYII